MSTPAPFQCELCETILTTRAFLERHKNKKSCRSKAARLANQKSRAAASSETQTSLPERLLNSFRSSRTLRRIPKGARPAAAAALLKAARQCLQKNDTEAWCAFLTFPSTAFAQPDKASKGKQSLTSIVKANISRPQVTLTEPVKMTAKKKPPDDDAVLRKRLEGKMNEGDISGALRVVISEDSIAPRNTETLESLKKKHPAEQPDVENLILPDDLPSAPQVTAQEIRNAVISFPNGSAGGADGLRPQHLKDLTAGLNDVMAEEFLEILASLATLMLNGKVPSEICPFLYGASLTALIKKDGGIRPIAVGCTLRRLAGKVVSKRVMSSMGELLRPEQVGYGTKGGSEAAVHAARLFLSSNPQDCQVLLKLDFKNAFNMVFRDKLLLEVQKCLPEYFPFVYQMYNQPSHLLYRDQTIQSARGVQQSDPLGPLLFCLVTKDLSKSLQSPFNCWYLDDATIGGDSDTVLEDFQTVVDQCTSLGLELNMAKCEMHIFGGTKREQSLTKSTVKRIFPDVAFLTSAELHLLGAPILEDAIPAVLTEKSRQAELMATRLTKLGAHHALFLLKNCLFLPKLLYILRCSLVWKFPNLLRDFDEILRRSAERITNTKMTDPVWKQTTLPVGKGGLGLRRAEEIALPAFLASISSAKRLVSEIVAEFDLDELCAAELTTWTELSGAELPLAELRVIQRLWDQPLVEKSYAQVLAFFADSEAETARILAASTKESGAWLNALPASCLGNLLDDDSLRISVGLRLGAPICEPHTCRCSATVDVQGRHGLSCKFSAGRHSRHSSLNESLRRALVSCQVQAILEPNGVLRDDSKKRPDGMTLVPCVRHLYC